MNSAQSTLEFNMSKKQFNDHMESALRAFGFLRDDQELKSIDYTALHLPSDDTLIPLTIGLKKHEGMVLIEH